MKQGTEPDPEVQVYSHEGQPLGPQSLGIVLSQATSIPPAVVSLQRSDLASLTMRLAGVATQGITPDRASTRLFAAPEGSGRCNHPRAPPYMSHWCTDVKWELPLERLKATDSYKTASERCALLSQIARGMRRLQHCTVINQSVTVGADEGWQSVYAASKKHGTV